LLKNSFVVFAAPKQGETLLNPSDLQKTAVFCLTPEKHLDDVFRCSQAIMRRVPDDTPELIQIFLRKSLRRLMLSLLQHATKACWNLSIILSKEEVFNLFQEKACTWIVQFLL